MNPINITFEQTFREDENTYFGGWLFKQKYVANLFLSLDTEVLELIDVSSSIFSSIHVVKISSNASFLKTASDTLIFLCRELNIGFLHRDLSSKRAFAYCKPQSFLKAEKIVFYD